MTETIQLLSAGVIAGSTLGAFVWFILWLASRADGSAYILAVFAVFGIVGIISLLTA